MPRQPFLPKFRAVNARITLPRLAATFFRRSATAEYAGRRE